MIQDRILQYNNLIKIERNDTADTIIYTPFKQFMRIVNSSGTYDYTYIYQDGVLVAKINPDGSKWYYHPDHLGSTTLVTDESGTVVEQTFYSPFGEVTSGGDAEYKLYTGQFSDSLTDQYYYGARYYKPSTGQFVQPDMLIQKIYNPQSLNRYSYVMNNPYKYIDPTGYDAELFGKSLGAGYRGAAYVETGTYYVYENPRIFSGYQKGRYITVKIGAMYGADASYSFSTHTYIFGANKPEDIEGVSQSIGGSISARLLPFLSVGGSLGTPLDKNRKYDFSKLEISTDTSLGYGSEYTVGVYESYTMTFPEGTSDIEMIEAFNDKYGNIANLDTSITETPQTSTDDLSKRNVIDAILGSVKNIWSSLTNLGGII